MNQLNLNPAFPEGNQDDVREVKQVETVESTEKETPSDTSTEAETNEAAETDKEEAEVAEGEKTPAQETEEKSTESTGDDAEVQKQLQGLQREKVALLKQIQDLRGQRRELKKDELVKVEQKMDELKDVSPEDVAVIDKVLRSKGYITKEEAGKMSYDSVKNEVLEKFLSDFPEYKPENDPHDINWSSLQAELGYYRMPDDPKKIRDILDRAHKSITKEPSDRGGEAKKQAVKTASVGSGGTQRSSSHTPFPSAQREVLLRGGWSEEEVREMENKSQ